MKVFPFILEEPGLIALMALVFLPLADFLLRRGKGQAGNKEKRRKT